MKNIVNRIESVVRKSKSFGYAVANLAKDMGVDIGVCEHVSIDIVDILPSIEDISPHQFRLAIVTAIVRSFDQQHNDIGRIPYLREMFEKFNRKDMLTTADMQSYHTMMFLLHPTKVKMPTIPV